MDDLIDLQRKQGDNYGRLYTFSRRGSSRLNAELLQPPLNLHSRSLLSQTQSQAIAKILADDSRLIALWSSDYRYLAFGLNALFETPSVRESYPEYCYYVHQLFPPSIGHNGPLVVYSYWITRCTLEVR